MRVLSTLLLMVVAFAVHAQDVTGTWEGEVVRDISATNGIQQHFKMKWELVQVEKEVYGIVYFYPMDTRANDKPNVWYSWYGKQTKANSFPFQFIQGRWIDGAGSSPIYQFNVRFENRDSAAVLSGNFYYQLESLNTRERPGGFYAVRKVSDKVSDALWLKRKEKEIIEKLEKAEKAQKSYSDK